MRPLRFQAAFGKRLLGLGKTRSHASEQHHANFAAIVLNGFFFPTAGKILGAGLVLAWSVSDLTSAAWVVGLLVPIQYGAALLAQPWLAQWISGHAARAPFYRNQALLRGVLWSALGVASWLIGTARPEVLLVIFFLVVVADAVAAGLGNIAFSDVLARAIPKQLRGRARGGRGMAGAILGGLAGILVAVFVAPESGFGVFGLLFLIAGLCYAIGGVSFAMIREPAAVQSRDASEPPPLRERIREMLGRSDYRRFLVIQALLVPVTQSLAFFTLFGRRELALDLRVLGLLVVSDAIAPFFGNLLWGVGADRRGNRWVIGGAALIGTIAPALALVLATVGTEWSRPLVTAAFGAIVLAVGVAAAGIDLASKNLILDLAPDAAQRPAYIGINDALIAIPTMLLIGAGVVVDQLGFRPLFVGVGLLAASAAGLTLMWRSARLS
jgi:MFS family permease